jgi:hypothetical protein
MNSGAHARWRLRLPAPVHGGLEAGLAGIGIGLRPPVAERATHYSFVNRPLRRMSRRQANGERISGPGSEHAA